jgi:hypothetical protein
MAASVIVRADRRSMRNRLLTAHGDIVCVPGVFGRGRDAVRLGLVRRVLFTQCATVFVEESHE